MNKYDMLRILTDRRLKALLILGVLFLMNLGVVFGQTEVDVDVLKRLGCLICKIMNLFFYIAGAVAALVIVIAGIKWVGSGDDPGARTAAKNTIVSAIIGLIVILLATYLVWWLVSGFFTGGQADPTGFVNGCTEECTF